MTVNSSLKETMAGDERVELKSLQAPETLPAYDEAETARILRKIDVRVIPVLALLYVLSFLDRSNIGNAKIAGLMDDLHLTGAQYNMALTVFFIPYILFEVPSNIVLKLMRPSRWIAVMVASWGTVVTLQGIVPNYQGLVITRFFMGLAESGFFPAATYLLTTWYCRFELQTRMAIFFSSANFASAFSGLLAAGIQNMKGIAGLSGWRWIFILEGIATVVIGTTAALALPDSPETAKFLTPEERAFVARRIRHDVGIHTESSSEEKKFSWALLWQALRDWRIYAMVLMYWGNSVSFYGFNYTAPSIILQLGYSSTVAQLLTVPIYAFGMIATLSVSYIADRRRIRWPFIVVPYSIMLVAFIGLMVIPHPRLPGLTYALLFAIPAGGHPPLMTTISWLSNNLSPSWKQAIGLAILTALGNAGGLVGSNIFLAHEAPRYHTGYGISLGFTALAIISALVARFAFKKENEKRERVSEDEVQARYTDEQIAEMGDKSPLFRYVL